MQEPTASEITKTTIRHHFSDIVNQGRIEKVDDLWANDCIIKGLQGTTFKGTKGLRKRISDFRKAIPDVKVRVDDVLVDRNKAVAVWEMSGTFDQDYKEIKATGKKFKVRGVDIFNMNKGKIQEDTLYFDFLDMLVQLDVI